MEVIKAKDLSKVYKLYRSPKHRLLESLAPVLTSPAKKHSALEGATFSFHKGETVGIVGRNGSGKSTLLKIITGLVEPTSGEVQVNGTISALLELGAGFNPQLTGLENIYFTALYYGRSRAFIEERLDDILAFADIGEYINQPVKTYSSGMYSRLAFSSAIHVEPDILILDEVLAVGDTAFQLKCIDKIEQIKQSGATILFVSHAIDQVKRACDRALWLNDGQVMAFGPCLDVCTQYEDFLSRGGVRVEGDRVLEDSSKPAHILNVSLDKDEVEPFGEISVDVTYEVNRDMDDLVLGVAIYTPDRKFLFGPNTSHENIDIPKGKGTHKVRYKITNCQLLPGRFYFDVGLSYNKGLATIDYFQCASHFDVKSNYFSEGLVYLKHEWSVDV